MMIFPMPQLCGPDTDQGCLGGYGGAVCGNDGAWVNYHAGRVSIEEIKKDREAIIIHEIPIR